MENAWAQHGHKQLGGSGSMLPQEECLNFRAFLISPEASLQLELLCRYLIESAAPPTDDFSTQSRGIHSPVMANSL